LVERRLHALRDDDEVRGEVLPGRREEGGHGVGGVLLGLGEGGRDERDVVGAVGVAGRARGSGRAGQRVGAGGAREGPRGEGGDGPEDGRFHGRSFRLLPYSRGSGSRPAAKSALTRGPQSAILMV